MVGLGPSAAAATGANAGNSMGQRGGAVVREHIAVFVAAVGQGCGRPHPAQAGDGADCFRGGPVIEAFAPSAIATGTATVIATATATATAMCSAGSKLASIPCEGYGTASPASSGADRQVGIISDRATGAVGATVGMWDAWGLVEVGIGLLGGPPHRPVLSAPMQANGTLEEVAGGGQHKRT